TQNRGGGNNVRFVSGPRALSSMEYKDVIVRIDSHAGDLAKDESWRELRPTMDHGIWFGNIRSRRQRERIDTAEYYQEQDTAHHGIAMHIPTSEQREYSSSMNLLGKL